MEDSKFTVKTLGQVAKFFGVSLQAVKQWRCGPDPMPGEPGAWPLWEIVRWRYAKVRHRIERNESAEQRKNLELAKLATDVQARQQELQRLAAGLVNREAAERQIASMVDRVCWRLQQVPDECATIFPPAIRDSATAEMRQKIGLICKEFESLGDLSESA